MTHEYKKTTTIYISEQVVTQAKALGIPISQTCEKVLRLLISMHGKTEEEVELAVLMTQRDRWDGELHAYEAQLAPFKKRLEVINRKIESQMSIVEEIRRSEEMARVMRTLNAKIKEANFDVVKVKELTVEEVAALGKFGIIVDDAWLERQCRRVAQLDNSL